MQRKLGTQYLLFTYLPITILILYFSNQVIAQVNQYELGLLNQLIARSPNDPDLYFDRGLLYGDAREFDDAIRDYSTAIKLDPKYTEAYYFRALAYGRLGHHDKAIDDYTRIIKMSPNHVDAYRMLGFEYFETRQYDQATRLAPNDPLPYLFRGDLYLELNEYTLAEAEYKRAYDLDPSLTAAQRMLNEVQSIKDDHTQEELVVSYTYSPAQRTLLDQLGEPEGFTIRICTLEDNTEQLVRNEEWNYYSYHAKFSFLDGALIGSEEIESFNEGSIVTPYSPGQFAYGMTFQKVLEVTGEKEFVLTEMIDEFVKDGDLYFTEQLTLAFLDDALFFIRSLPLISIEE